MRNPTARNRHDPDLAAKLYAKAPSKLEATLALHMKAAGLKPESEFRFHPPRRWRFDFAFPDQKVAIEAEGGTWSGGRHVRGSGFEKDAEKYNQAALDGWTLLRFTSAIIQSGEALAQIEAALMREGDNAAAIQAGFRKPTKSIPTDTPENGINPLYITDKQVAARYEISRPSVWRWVRKKHMPPPEAIGPNTKRWRVPTLDDWDASRADQPIIK